MQAGLRLCLQTPEDRFSRVAAKMVLPINYLKHTFSGSYLNTLHGTFSIFGLLW